MYAAPLQNIATLCKTRDQNLIPIHISIAGFLSSLLWTLYGLLYFDINIIVPNIIGFAFTVFQIVIWIYFWYNSKHVPSLEEFIGGKKIKKTE